MRQVSGCDFCGDTPSGTFEVLPSEYDPDGEGKRMVLCDRCRDTIASVLDPLLDAKSERSDVEPNVDETTEREAEPASVNPASSDTDGVDAGDSDEEDAAGREKSEMASTGAGASSRVPKGYRKVVRFLENREFPLDHGDAVEMVAGAYELDESAVEAAIDHADSHDRLRVAQGEIREP